MARKKTKTRKKRAKRRPPKRYTVHVVSKSGTRELSHHGLSERTAKSFERALLRAVARGFVPEGWSVVRELSLSADGGVQGVNVRIKREK